ncbi:hypothetical protein IO99_06820 [Clostridium sulfidigenes]|uniref:Uncharacterized protein n=1 Tax=Clostridium sulfidigenes TaxID=318464 RepID=A0A084JE89_9CLOT|nr:hypothetical protein [Clostridium sulfidigenes]KEZ87273.1 hypothetical protein IO99_06820 [Clostridium sulfidigenes]
MKIDDSIIKYCLKNVMFITGTAYAGKSTMVKRLAEKYNLISREENYHFNMTSKIAKPELFPNVCYFETMKDWQEFVNRSPESYEKWIEESNLEIAELIRVSKDRKVIVDTNIPVELLKNIADYNQVAIMLSPQSMAIEQFFNRDDADKKFIKEQILKSKNPEKVMANYLEGIARVNNKEHYEKYRNSGFFTLVRDNIGIDTKEEVMSALALHFGLKEEEITKQY